jgi:hypothetical protein
MQDPPLNNQSPAHHVETKGAGADAGLHLHCGVMPFNMSLCKVPEGCNPTRPATPNFGHGALVTPELPKRDVDECRLRLQADANEPVCPDRLVAHLWKLVMEVVAVSLHVCCLVLYSWRRIDTIQRGLEPSVRELHRKRRALLYLPRWEAATTYSIQ